jgi:hypothetical protein
MCLPELSIGTLCDADLRGGAMASRSPPVEGRNNWILGGAVSDDDSPGLGEIIRRVSDELLDAQAARRASGREAVFEVSALDIELNFVVTRSRLGRGGIDLKIVSAGGEMQYESQQVQKVTVRLAAPAERPESATYDFYDPAPPVRPRRDFSGGPAAPPSDDAT